jgi:phosphopantetheine adenylyltransferase
MLSVSDKKEIREMVSREVEKLVDKIVEQKICELKNVVDGHGVWINEKEMNTIMVDETWKELQADINKAREIESKRVNG